MLAPVTCRRRKKRHSFTSGAEATVEFVYPFAGEEAFSLPLRDISGNGLSFRLEFQLPLLEPGDTIDEVRITVGGHVIDGELLVMHLSPDNSPGAVCGGLFFPASDEDLLELNELLEELSPKVHA